MKYPNIPNWPNYHITKSGKLFSNHSGEWREVKPCIKGNGYVHNILHKTLNGIKYKANLYRHRLVAEAYIPNPDKLNCVCHRDNNPLNNKVSNLYWGTNKDNMGQCKQDGRYYFIGSIRKQKTYSRINPEAIAQDYKDKLPRKVILQKWNISVGVLYDILKQQNITLRLPRKNGES